MWGKFTEYTGRTLLLLDCSEVLQWHKWGASWTLGEGAKAQEEVENLKHILYLYYMYF